jgi:putative ABC transport system permease protein
VVCIALVGISAFGIIGLTSYWVAQRRRQIGIRRALGATRHNIVRYFQTENFLIVAAGAGAGATIAVFLNLWMVTFFEMPRLPVSYVVISIICVFFLGQIAAFWPALKAATISPVEATRG